MMIQASGVRLARARTTATAAAAWNRILAPRQACFSASTFYIDEWFETIRKSTEFYERCANGRPRRYFYNIDLQGRLFLEETTPKNIATSIKDPRFLDFFFSRIRRASDKESGWLLREDHHRDYPFVSRCGAELNFIRPAATPIVFHSLVGDTLFYGGSLGVPFDRERLAVSRDSGKLYHRIAEGGARGGGAKNNHHGMEYGLISTSVGVALSGKITVDEDDDGAEKFRYENDMEIDWLPPDCEPGEWSMPDGDVV